MSLVLHIAMGLIFHSLNVKCMIDMLLNLLQNFYAKQFHLGSIQCHILTVPYYVM